MNMESRPKRGEKVRAGKTWSESRYWSFIRSNLRRAWTKYPVKFHVLNKARRPYKGDDARTKWEYKCSICTKWWKMKQVEVDHIKPAGALRCYADLPSFVNNLLCEEDNLRVVCKECHKIVTEEQRKNR